MMCPCRVDELTWHNRSDVRTGSDGPPCAGEPPSPGDPRRRRCVTGDRTHFGSGLGRSFGGVVILSPRALAERGLG